MPRLGRERSAVLLVAWTLLGLAPGVRAQLAAAAWRFAGNAGRGFVGPVIALRDSSTDSLYLLHDRDGSSLAPAFLWRSDDFGVTWNTLRSSSPDTLVSLKADPFRSGTLLALHALKSADVVVHDALVDPRVLEEMRATPVTIGAASGPFRSTWGSGETGAKPSGCCTFRASLLRGAGCRGGGGAALRVLSRWRESPDGNGKNGGVRFAFARKD